MRDLEESIFNNLSIGISEEDETPFIPRHRKLKAYF
jgi:hypothetical protein